MIKTPQGGWVACEPGFLELWHLADGCSLEEISARAEDHGSSPMELCAALACLAEAGLLIREGWRTELMREIPSLLPTAPVSVVIVNYDSQEWLAECLPSVLAQTARPEEVVVVDNASSQDPTVWVQEHFPEVKILRLAQMQSLASAINRGVELTRCEYILILNPDVHLESDAVAQLLSVVSSDETCAAVAPKLKFWWAPAFLNGIGNQPGLFRWGADNGLGHLDLGQFDGWEGLPSVCFAAALIRRSVWETVGTCDEGFRFYYEDTEWSFRARLMGWHVRAAPQAVIYHAFGRRVHTGQEADLTPDKLRNVVYGRLRFVGKITSGSNLVLRLAAALFHDSARALLYLLKGNWQGSAAMLRGWFDFFASLPELRTARQGVQNRRVRSEAELFATQEHIPPPLIWRGLPRLGWKAVRHHYLPVILTGKTRKLPEFEE